MIVIHFYGDDTYVDATQTDVITPTNGSGGFVGLDNGDEILVVKDVETLKRDFPRVWSREKVQEALREEGL